MITTSGLATKYYRADADGITISGEPFSMAGVTDGVLQWAFNDWNIGTHDSLLASCSYCRNASGLTDQRGNCISCGAPLEAK